MITLHPAKVISFLMLLVTVYSINQWSKIDLGNTFVWWVIDLFVLVEFVKAKKLYYDIDNNRFIRVIYLFLAWNIICVIRGLFVADNYWQWKDLTGNAIIFLMPLSIYVTTNKQLMQNIIGSWFKYALPAFILFVPIFALPDAMGRYLVPVSFAALFFPVLSKKWKIITLIFTLIVIFGALDARSSVIKFSLSLLLSSIYLFRKLFIVKLLGVIRLLLLIMPIILFSLALSGVFNIFRMDDYIKGDYKTTVVQDGATEEESLTVDTRTFLYQEVLASAVKYNYIWLGRTPARGNESPSFGEYSMDVLKTGTMDRPYNEAGILNTFTWTGLVGVILYFLVFYQASYLAIKKSSNIFIKIVGTYVAFRWAFSWVEDFSAFDLSYFYLWVLIGMCFSKSFREMDDLQMKNWILGIFDKRYRVLDIDLNESTDDNEVILNQHNMAVLKTSPVCS
jgi:hypothetical protein